MSETLETEVCCDCNEPYPVDDIGWSHAQEAPLCRLCEESDMQYASTIRIVTLSEVRLYYVGKHIRMTEFGDDLYNTNLTIDRTWVSSSEWRGHYETTIEGWTDVMNGWTTGGWDDPIARRKATFNQWADSVLTGEVIPPVAVAIVADPTSNVFSMGISVLTPEPNAFKEWLDTEFDELYEALT